MCPLVAVKSSYPCRDLQWIAERHVWTADFHVRLSLPHMAVIIVARETLLRMVFHVPCVADLSRLCQLLKAVALE